MDTHILRHTSWYKSEHYALGAAVVGIAVLVGALVVTGEADVAASKQFEHQWPDARQFCNPSRMVYPKAKMPVVRCMVYLSHPELSHNWACLKSSLVSISFIHLTEW